MHGQSGPCSDRRTRRGKGKKRNDVRSTALDVLAQLVGAVVLVEEVVGDLLEVGQVAVQQGAADGQEVRVARVLHLDQAPGVLPRAHPAPAHVDGLLGADDGEGHEPPQLRVLLHCVLVVLLDVVGEVVDGDPVVLDVLHHQLLRLGQLGGRQRVGFADDGDHVDAR